MATEKSKLLNPAVGLGGMIPVKQELRELTSMALQLSLRQMVRQVMTITDAAFQGHIGTKQLAGVALAGMWMGVPSAFIQFAIQAISTLCSQAYGAGNNSLVGTWLQTSIVFAVVGAIPVMIWYMFVGEMIALTMDDPETVMYGSEFARIMAIGLIPQYIYGCLTTYFATLGVIMPATICSCFTMLLNIFFNQLFIYGWDGFGGFGFIGSPLATVASTCVQLLLFVLYTIVWQKYHQNFWAGWSWDCVKKERVQVFLALAIPMGASSVVDWASATLAGAFSGYLGPNIAAAQAVLNGLFGVVNSCVNGFSMSTQIRMSRYLGQGSAEGAKRVLLIGSTIVMSCSFVLLLVVLPFRRELFSVWSNDPIIIDMCSDVIVVFVICILVAFSRFLLTSCLNALSMANLNLIANNIASWCVYVPLSYLLPITLGWGLDGFWWADTLGELLKAIILFWGVLRVDWHDAADQAQCAAEAKDVDDDEKRELDTLKNEAMAPTPPSFKSPAALGLSSTPGRTPNRTMQRRAAELTPKVKRTSSNVQV
ncbi:hypothetical protein SPRG_00311 [Saprolegnia parasitica CBS 223.65]|uniref:MATE efflux family protein n=1 Tax=Saprolegnia parasitica (strain CBS 223.65) TaxID=695850 RepID=A0A067CXM3_SAPPC|nr:hypothetical protein SPRG_00311 [Saprolegnia parasitica CBS 223.65]KDO35464.1 hypothetical protein SPRG_00311 [Saprolegnia parasitica CBS 223.65]|eukprot:XP_012193801.1 hypothetical protein SPRG_00311 [Saprolegnia parasitica CBS 223.65]